MGGSIPRNSNRPELLLNYVEKNLREKAKKKEKV